MCILAKKLLKLGLLDELEEAHDGNRSKSCQVF